ncbi:DMT family transporter [Kitasatospora sp. NPDC051853]|uniref:DMT family transporter n=1 Tax=Kitasatospora sp. NPDC051853 TaxID=3364058 RepID=UPI0037B17FCF
MPTHSTTLRGSLAAATAMTAVGSSAAVSPLLTAYPLFAGQSWRYLAAGLILLLPGRRLPPPPRLTIRQRVRVLVLAATGMAGFNVFLLNAVAHADAATVGAVVGATPVVLAVAGPLLDGRRPSARVAFGALLTVLGVLLIQSHGSATPTGLLHAAGALACECCFSLIAVPLLPVLGPRRLSALACLTAVPLLAATSALLEGPRALRLPTPTEALALSYLTLVVTALAFFLWYAGVARLGVDRAGLFAGLIPIAAALLGALLGTAPLTPPVLLGAALVGAAVGYGVTTPPRRRPDDTSWARRALLSSRQSPNRAHNRG